MLLQHFVTFNLLTFMFIQLLTHCFKWI